MTYLETILHQGSEEDFPQRDKSNYLQRLGLIQTHLKPIQEAATPGALLAEFRSKIDKGEIVDPDELIYLNSHGPDHIQAVIDRASDMLRVHQVKITAYEAYVLLVAINLHDVGNVGGRVKHEKRVFEHIEDMGDLMGTNAPEKALVGKIAAVHGGKIGDSKDTIRVLQEEDYILSQKIQPRFLAALLRFADELADDLTRASRYELNKNHLPEQSKIYHRYSEALSSVSVDKGKVLLKYVINWEIAVMKFEKGGEQVYLLDEIYERILKMHRERIYCMRHLRKHFEIEKIEFTIVVNHPNDPLDSVFEIRQTIEESGFPGAPQRGITELCPGLKNKEGAKVAKDIEDLKGDG